MISGIIVDLSQSRNPVKSLDLTRLVAVSISTARKGKRSNDESKILVPGILMIRVFALLFLTCAVALSGASGCATKRKFHGLPATDLSGLDYGMQRLSAESITGDAVKEFRCNAGTIVSYRYDRGWVGCLEEGSCEPETEARSQTAEIVIAPFTLGLYSLMEPECAKPCQQGILELFFDRDDRLIGARELPTDRDDFCWRARTEKCARFYQYRRPPTISESLVLQIDPENIPDKICDQFER